MHFSLLKANPHLRIWISWLPGKEGKEEHKNNPQVYTTQEGKEEIKSNPQVYTTQEGIEEIKNNPQVYTTQEGIEQIETTLRYTLPKRV